MGFDPMALMFSEATVVTGGMTAVEAGLGAQEYMPGKQAITRSIHRRMMYGKLGLHFFMEQIPIIVEVGERYKKATGTRHQFRSDNGKRLAG